MQYRFAFLSASLGTSFSILAFLRINLALLAGVGLGLWLVARSRFHLGFGASKPENWMAGNYQVMIVAGGMNWTSLFLMVVSLLLWSLLGRSLWNRGLRRCHGASR